MTRPGPRIVAAAAAAVALVLALLVVTVRPVGRDDAAAAAREEVPDGAKAVGVLATREWGRGALVLTRYLDGSGRRTYVFGFAADRGRGWRMISASTQRGELEDVRVGSMVVSSSAGGDGQPAWTAVFGELQEARIARVEISFSEGDPLSADRENDTYLVLRRGGSKPLTARFLASDGAEIARVPIA